jgi:transmembrane sensor
MNPAAESNDADDSGIREIAARWVVRQDRRLAAEEASELSAWLAADPRHAMAFKQSAASWDAYREIALAVRRMPAEVIEPRSKSNWMGVGMAAAAAVALATFAFVRESRFPQGSPETASETVSATSAPLTRHFADGSIARLKGEAEIAEAFSPAERRIRLVRGEAFFSVVKDETRPFLVEVGNVTVRAVGTAFAIRFETQAVDVLVTEGTVRVTPAAPEQAGGEEPEHSSALVTAGYRAVVARTSEPHAPRVVVTAVSNQNIAQSLAWNNPMLDLADTTLGEVVAAFSQRTGRRIEIADPDLATVRIGGRYPTHDIDGFVRVLEEIYDVKSERRADSSIVLRKAR